MRDELPNAPEEWRARAISGSAKPRPDHLLPRGRGPVRLPLSKWEDQDESHLTGRELLASHGDSIGELICPVGQRIPGARARNAREGKGVSAREGKGVAANSRRKLR